MMFYIGTLLMLLGVLLWAYAQFTLTYKSDKAAIAIAVPIALSIPLGLLFKTHIHRRERVAAEEFLEREQRDVAEVCREEELDYQKELSRAFRGIAEEGDEVVLGAPHYPPSPSHAHTSNWRGGQSDVPYHRAYTPTNANDNSGAFATAGGADNCDGVRYRDYEDMPQQQQQQQQASGRLHPTADAAGLTLSIVANGTDNGSSRRGGEHMA